ncbi:MAG: hypothetical protein K2P51_02035 [Rhabdochlamydiaceae bacterium]|nr:hypothetical protein [Rhabdochlamydiaceae bacterium]
MTSAIHVQSFREAYEAYKASYHEIKAKGEERLNDYSTSEKAYRTFKKIGKQLQGQSSHLEPKQKQIVSQVLEKIRQVRHSQKADANEKITSSFTKATATSTTSASSQVQKSSTFFEPPFFNTLLEIMAVKKEQASINASSPKPCEDARITAFRQNLRAETSKRETAFQNAIAATLLQIHSDTLHVKGDRISQAERQEYTEALRQGLKTSEEIGLVLIHAVDSICQQVSLGFVANKDDLDTLFDEIVQNAMSAAQTSFECHVSSVFKKNSTSTAEFVYRIRMFQKSLHLSHADLLEIAKHPRLDDAAAEFVRLTRASFENDLKALLPMLVPYFSSNADVASSSSVPSVWSLSSTGFDLQVKQKQVAFESALPVAKQPLEQMQNIVTELVSDVSNVFRLVGPKTLSRVGIKRISNEKELTQAFRLVVAHAVQRTRDSFEELAAGYAKNSRTYKQFVNQLRPLQQSFYLTDADLAKIARHRHVHTAATEFCSIGATAFVERALKPAFPMLVEYFPA